MTVWLREFGGWLLVLAGLWVFVLAYDMLLHKRVFEAAPLTFMGFVVFRGGIHLLKVAVAARVAAAPAEADPKPAPARRPVFAPPRPIGPTPPGAVIPGAAAVPTRPPTSRP